MGYKSVCVNCRKSFNRSIEKEINKFFSCPECGNTMTLLSHRFRPPKKSDEKKWEVVKFLIDKGFYYQHINKLVDDEKSEYDNNEFAKYPLNLKDALIFVEKYKGQIKK